MSVLARIVDFVGRATARPLRTTVRSFIRLETAEDDRTLIAEDGSLVTMVRVLGCRRMVGEPEIGGFVDKAVTAMAARFRGAGYAMQVHYACDPETAHQVAVKAGTPARAAARAIGLDFDDLLDARERHVARMIVDETVHLTLWSRPFALVKKERVEAGKTRKSWPWVRADQAQDPRGGLAPLRRKHATFLGGVLDALRGVEVEATVLDVHEAGRAIRDDLHRDREATDFRLRLPWDRPAAGVPTAGDGDPSALLWPPVSMQLADGRDAERLSTECVRIGTVLWGAVEMTVGPNQATTFQALLERLREAGIPWRMSVLVESAGVSWIAWRLVAGRILAALPGSGVTGRVVDALKWLQELAMERSVVKIRVSFATWERTGSQAELGRRLALLQQAVEGWGECLGRTVCGDPLEGVLSSALGIACASTAPTAVAPLSEVVRMLPLTRPCSPFPRGTVPLRTPDGGLFPATMGSEKQSSWFDLIYGVMGSGKSVHMLSLALGLVLRDGTSRLPYIAHITIGHGAEGLVELIREALPVNRRHECAAYKLEMSRDYAINPFDCRLGARRPLPQERTAMIEALVMIATSADADGGKAPAGIAELAAMVLDLMFESVDDGVQHGRPKEYAPHVDPVVDAAIAELAAEGRWRGEAGKRWSWRQVVDTLFAAGRAREAMLAQRYAVPILQDAVEAVSDPRIVNVIGTKCVSGSGERVIDHFRTAINIAVGEFPILGGPTRWEPGARIIALDLQNVAPKGGGAAARQAAIMYTLAIRAVTARWWVDVDDLSHFPEMYRAWHQEQAVDLKETFKLLNVDEWHNTGGLHGVRRLIQHAVRVGRKYRIAVCLGSQRFEDMDPEMIDLSQTRWVMSAGDETIVKTAAERYSLSESAIGVLRRRLTGARAGYGAPALMIADTKDGTFVREVVNSLDPMTVWAVSTTRNDVLLRDRLYGEVGVAAALRVLTARFPGGSADSEIGRMVAVRTERRLERATESAVIEDLAAELLKVARAGLYRAA